MITEKLLHYIWQFQYFNNKQLLSVGGEPIQIIHPGYLNTNQGPDFLDAKIKINNTLWAGSVELHIKTSDWQAHKHSKDKNYNNVILHVVWQDDMYLNLPFAAIEIQQNVSKILLEKYEEWMNTPSFIPCQKNINTVQPIAWLAWKERLLVERLQQKSAIVLQHIQTNQIHWEETLWWMLAKNFGIKVNSDAFEKMAQSISINTLAKHKHQIHQTEALLFGQAGLLQNNFVDPYPAMLQKEYQFLQKKYQLTPIIIPIHFLRMRPANFPTIRLAQLAMLIHNSVHLFSKIKAASSLKEVKDFLDVTANDYWHYHYNFDDESDFKLKNLGGQMVDNILINTVVPILFGYGMYYKDDSLKEKALNWLQQIGAEKNSITNGFMAINIENKSAFDSQALIQLKNYYCNKKRCLECAVGNKILKNS
jgi:Protein of unknown function (DUF2851)